MGILDEAIKEHLELKKHNGADESELSKLESEAFGASARPGEESIASAEDAASAEAPTEFLSVAQDAAQDSDIDPELRVAEAEPGAEVVAPEEPAESPVAEAPATEAPVEPEAADATGVPPEDVADTPAAEQSDREEMSGHPTEHYDVAAEHLAADADAENEAPEATDTPTASATPAGPDTEPFGGSPFDETAFFDQQTLSDELDKALDAPPHPDDEWDDETPAAPASPPAADVAAPAEPAGAPPADSEPAPLPDEPETGSSFFDDGEEDEEAQAPLGPDEDVLEDTPEFLRDAPESDSLWFDQKPPKDFDFDD